MFPGREVDHACPPPPQAEVKNAWISASNLKCLHGVVLISVSTEKIYLNSYTFFTMNSLIEGIVAASVLLNMTYFMWIAQV
jgi:hypothetical protein